MTSPNLTKENYIKFIKSANQSITTELVENIYLQTKELIANYLQKGSEVDLFGCVKLKIKLCKARKGRNPKTGAVIDVPAKNKVVAKVSKTFSDSFNG
jgi:nucleoid DNA-binding protein